MPDDFLLIHSPLVGPSVWQPMRQLLEAFDRRVAVPDLRSALEARTGQRGAAFVSAAARAAVGDDVVLVGFSGAGVHLPAVADALDGRVAMTCFVDAVVPPATGRHELSPPFAAFIDTKTDGGLLQPWIEWWPEEVAKMLPDPALRRAIGADMPRVPWAFYDEEVVVHDGWVDGPNCYLRTSVAYREDHERAEGFGWPTAQLAGTHLSIATEPHAVIDAIDRLRR